MSDIIIIGAGASGIMTSIFAKDENNNVTILEKNNKPLKKLLITGNGRCNYLNERYSMNNYHSSNILLTDKIISDKNINLVKEFFDDIGIVPRIKNDYYYPFTNQANTVYNALLKESLGKGVDIIYDMEVVSIEKKNNKFIVKCNNNSYSCDKLVIATGSYAFPKTGSDGIGYKLLEKLGHNIIKPLPALVGLNTSFKDIKKLSGVRSEVRLELEEDNKVIASEEGEIQFTDYGLSGICIFNLSNYITRGLDKGLKEVIKINFVPFIETLITPWMDKYSKKLKDRTIEELLEGFLNYKIVDVLLKVCKINKNSYYKDLSNEEKLLLCKNLRSFKVEIISTKGYDHSQICNGGLDLEEVDVQSMESKKIKNLYITGELLDINGNCGGYNLTTCWISGMLAGKSIGDSSD